MSWVLATWTLVVVALLIAAWVFIFTSPDDFGLNGVLAVWAFAAAIVFWVAGAIVMAILARLVRRIHHRS